MGADFNFWIFGLVLGGENLLGFLKKLNPEEPKSLSNATLLENFSVGCA